MAEKGLKQRIRDGEVVNGVGVAMDIGKAELEEVLGRADYDYVAGDCQHVAMNEERLTSFCATTNEMGVSTRIRIKHTRDAYLIGNYLDLGPTGIMVPEVDRESVVDEALNAFYYPQKGKRSWGGTDRVGLGERPDRLAYAAWWNDFGVLTIQVESVDAVINARQLAKPGVDVLSFGFNDLMFSLEAHPEFPFRTVQDCVRHVVDQVKGTGVAVGVRPETEAEEDVYIDMGVTVMLERLGKWS